jgi:hypothetical protein
VREGEQTGQCRKFVVCKVLIRMSSSFIMSIVEWMVEVGQRLLSVLVMVAVVVAASPVPA